ncbi:hypothetical protein G6686_02190 [Polynucleobacter paneuropaeus]|nr:hypothetical protein G6686_02190 [Polynucleobacter paneuropaeus]
MSEHLAPWMLHDILDPHAETHEELIKLHRQLVKVVRDQHDQLTKIKEEAKLKDNNLINRSGTLNKLNLFQYSRRTLFRLAMLRYWNFPQKGDMREMGTIQSDGESINRSSETFIAPFPYSHKEIAEGTNEITAPKGSYKNKVREIIIEIIEESLERSLNANELDWVQELTSETSIKRMAQDFLK